MIYEKNGFFVQQDQSGNWTVYRHSKSGTHSESDSAYPAGIDGLSLAVCRAMYLAGHKAQGKSLAHDAMAMPGDISGKARKMAQDRRAALAAFDAEFMAQA